MQGDILNNLIDVALACDEDADMVLSDKEINGAIEKLEQVHGIDVDNEGVRKTLIENGRSLDGKSRTRLTRSLSVQCTRILREFGNSHSSLLLVTLLFLLQPSWQLFEIFFGTISHWKRTCSASRRSWENKHGKRRDQGVFAV